MMSPKKSACVFSRIGRGPQDNSNYICLRARILRAPLNTQTAVGVIQTCASSPVKFDRFLVARAALNSPLPFQSFRICPSAKAHSQRSFKGCSSSHDHPGCRSWSSAKACLHCAGRCCSWPFSCVARPGGGRFGSTIICHLVQAAPCCYVRVYRPPEVDPHSNMFLKPHHCTIYLGTTMLCPLRSGVCDTPRGQQSMCLVRQTLNLLGVRIPAYQSKPCAVCVF